MNASNLQKKISYKERIISKVGMFNRKHKYLSLFGLAYAFIAIITYNIAFYFYRNVKRFTCLACIVLFFISSSSFSYPAMSLNISFDSEIIHDDSTTGDVIISDEEIAESDVELAQQVELDSEVLIETQEIVNPDVTEADHLNQDNQASLDDILEAGFDDGSEIVIDDENVALATDDAYHDISFNRDDWKIMLVNKQHPIPDDYDFPLGTISGSMRCDERIIQPLLDMMKAARNDGVSLIICSPYRDMDRQTMLFTNKVNRYMDAGMSYMDA